MLVAVSLTGVHKDCQTSAILNLLLCQASRLCVIAVLIQKQMVFLNCLNGEKMAEEL